MTVAVTTPLPIRASVVSDCASAASIVPVTTTETKLSAIVIVVGAVSAAKTLLISVSDPVSVVTAVALTEDVVLPSRARRSDAVALVSVTVTA